MKKIVAYLGLFRERGCINAKEFRIKVIELFANKYTCEQKCLKEVQHSKVKGIYDRFPLSPVYLHLILVQVHAVIPAWSIHFKT